MRHHSGLVTVCALIVGTFVYCLPDVDRISDSSSRYRINGANLTDIEKYPYTVTVYSNWYDLVIGGGAVLNHRWILTAAYPVERQEAQYLSIRGGSNDSQSGGQYARIDRVIINLTSPYDINVALLKTATPLKFNKKLRPIKLATWAPKTNSVAVLSGLGYNNRYYGKLSAAPFTIVNNKACRQKYNNTILCASPSSYKPDFDDLGDPLVQKKRLVGFYVGWSDQPPPTIFMKIAGVCRQWIIDTIKMNSVGDEADGIY